MRFYIKQKKVQPESQLHFPTKIINYEKFNFDSRTRNV